MATPAGVVAMENHGAKSISQVQKVSGTSDVPLPKATNLLEKYGRNLVILLDGSAQEVIMGEEAVCSTLQGLLSAESCLILTSEAVWRALIQNIRISKKLKTALASWDIFSYNDDFLLFIPKAHAITPDNALKFGINLQDFKSMSARALIGYRASTALRCINLVSSTMSACIGYDISARVLSVLQSLLMAKRNDPYAATYPWTFFIGGHGGSMQLLGTHMICDMAAYYFKGILQWIDRNCATKFLMYIACQAGSREASIDAYKNGSRAASYSFPILFWGVGNLPSRVDVRNWNRLFENLHPLAITPGNADKLFKNLSVGITGGYSFYLSQGYNNQAVGCPNWPQRLPNVEIKRKKEDEWGRPQIRWAYHKEFHLLVNPDSSIVTSSRINAAELNVLPANMEFHYRGVPSALEWYLDTQITHKPVRVYVYNYNGPQTLQIDSTYPDDRVHYIHRCDLANISYARDILGAFVNMSGSDYKRTILIESCNYANHKAPEEGKAKNIMVFNYAACPEGIGVHARLMMYYELGDCSYVAYIDNPKMKTIGYDKATNTCSAIKTKALTADQAAYFKNLFAELKSRTYNCSHDQKSYSIYRFLATAHPMVSRAIILPIAYAAGYALRALKNYLGIS